MKAVFMCDTRPVRWLTGYVVSPRPLVWFPAVILEPVSMVKEGPLPSRSATDVRNLQFLLQSVGKDNDTAYYVELTHPSASVLLDPRTRNARFNIPDDPR